jgi:hypothetical protein
MLRSVFPILPAGLLLLGSLWVQGAGAGVAADKAGAMAAQPSVAPAPKSLDARSLGIAEAVLDYCAQNDPTGGAKVQARLKRLAQGASKEALDKARKSGGYQSAHDSEVDFISKIDPHNAHRLCSETAARSK